MHSFAATLAPIALLLLPSAAADSHAALTPRTGQIEAPAGFDAAQAQPFETFFDSYRPSSRNQVRVRQRIVIRITARRPNARENLSADFPERAPVSTHLEERKMGDCVRIQDIAGVDPGPENRLILYMRDRTLVSAALDRECSAREFYSGFYIDRTEDGKLCVKRDKLQSRAGASCEVKQLARLVSVRD
jgi:hypothetical protein